MSEESQNLFPVALRLFHRQSPIGMASRTRCDHMQPTNIGENSRAGDFARNRSSMTARPDLESACSRTVSPSQLDIRISKFLQQSATQGRKSARYVSRCPKKLIAQSTHADSSGATVISLVIYEFRVLWLRQSYVSAYIMLSDLSLQRAAVMPPESPPESGNNTNLTITYTL